MSNFENWFEVKVEPGYAAFAEVTPPPGFKEISRAFDLKTNTLLKVFFEKVKEG